MGEPMDTTSNKAVARPTALAKAGFRRHQRQSFLVTETGKVPAHCEVAINALGAQALQKFPVVLYEVLENQGKPDQSWVKRLRGSDDFLGIPFNVNHMHGIAMLAQHRSQVTQAQVSHIQKAHQHDRSRGVALTIRGRGSLKNG